MRKIAQANIDRFNALLEDETDPIKRAMIVQLRAEEQEKLKSLPKLQRKQV
jgi:hypothetical protein